MIVELSRIDGPGLLRVEVTNPKKIGGIEYFDLKLTFEFHSGVDGDSVIIRDLRAPDIALMLSVLQTAYAGTNAAT